MAAADERVTSHPNPTPSTAVATTPATPAKEAPAPVKSPPSFDTYDAVLVVVVLAFAFLVSSFAATNSDFFFQAASGKLLAQGRYHFGEDPFASTTENVYWANHSWLFGVVAHGVYDSFSGHGTDDACVGGVILVVAKALLVTCLAGLLIAAGRKRGQSLWIPTVCAALAILAMSPRLYLNSTTLSFVFLGLTLYLLRQPRWNPPPAPVGPTKKGKANEPSPVTVGYPFKAFWAIPPLCALWVNVDSWFIFGPITVGLYLIGELIEHAQTQTVKRTDGPATEELTTLSYVLVASIAACFLSPHHYHAWQLPAQLGLTGAGETLRDDPLMQLLFLSPFEKFYLTEARVGLNAAGLAYYPLLALGFVSFGLTLKQMRWWRLLLWLPFALFSGGHARAIPFFAVVAAPIMALNYLDFAEQISTRAFTQELGWHLWRVIGRIARIVGGLALVVCTIPGWLQAQPQEKRRVAWNVHVEPSWLEVSKQLAEWRNAGLVSDSDHWFNASPDVVNYLAYYSEGRYGFLDARLNLFDETAADFKLVRDSLYPNPKETPPSEAASKEPPAPPKTAWREVFPKYHVRYLILHTNDPTAVPRPIPPCLATPEEWTPLYADGETFIFGWTPPAEKPPPQWAGMRPNYNRQAFGADAHELRRAHPADPPRAREWYEALWEPEKPRSLAVSRGAYHQIYQSLERKLWENRKQREWQDTAFAASLAGGTFLYIAMGDPRSRIVQDHFNALEPPPPAPAYLTVRQIQQSLADNPNDAQAYLRLGVAYSDLLWGTMDQLTTPSYQIGYWHPILIRQTQIVTALNHALQLDPDLELAHVVLANHYSQCSAGRVPTFYEKTADKSGERITAVAYIDLEYKHRAEQLRLSQKRGVPPGLKEEVERLKRQVEQQDNVYQLKAAGKPVVSKAQIALQARLGEEAQSVLEKADVKELFTKVGARTLPTGAVLRMKLLLSLGRVEEVRDVLNEDKDQKMEWGLMQDLTLPTRSWFQIMASAALGDYETADIELERVEQQIHADNAKGLPMLAERYGNALMVLDNASLLPLITALKAGLLSEMVQVSTFALQAECDIKTLRGWLALEAGNIELARKEFREVLDIGIVREPNLAASAAVGAAFSAAQDQRRLPSNARLLDLHSLPLAASCLRWIDNANE